MAEQSRGARRAAPKGYEKQNTDVSGYWTEDQPIHFIPKGVKLLDGNIQKIKPSIIVMGELVEATVVANKDEDPREARPGEIVGVWYKPGMRGIEQCSGLKTWLDLDIDPSTGQQRTKDVKKGNPMNLYLVQTAPGSKKSRVPIIEDAREKSRQVATPFDNPDLKPIRRRPETEEEAEHDNDVEAPF